MCSSLHRWMVIQYVLLVFGACFYILDVSLDGALAIQHHNASDTNWMGVTILLILIPGIINGLLTIMTVKPSTEERNADDNDYPKGIRVLAYVLSCLMMGPIFWDIHALYVITRGVYRKQPLGNGANSEEETEIRKKLEKKQKLSEHMGIIGRGFEAMMESIPQWLFQIYIIGLSNGIKLLQIVSLLSSLLTATYCVLDGGRVIIGMVDKRKPGTSMYFWKYSLLLFCLWMILALLTYPAASALYAAKNGGAWIFFLLIFFYVYMFAQFILMLVWKDKAGQYQRTSILMQLGMFFLTLHMVQNWQNHQPEDAMNILVQPKLSGNSNDFSINLKILEKEKNFTFGWKPMETNNQSYTGYGELFQMKVVEKTYNISDLHQHTPRENETIIVLKFKKLSYEKGKNKTNKFQAGICDNLLSEFSLNKLWNDFSEVVKDLKDKDVVCLSNIAGKVYYFLYYMNFVWTFYHIIFITSLDWIFWKDDKTRSDTELNSMGQDLYVTQSGEDKYEN